MAALFCCRNVRFVRGGNFEDESVKGETLFVDENTAMEDLAKAVDHGPRLYVCQGFAPKHQMRLYVCHQMRLYVCHQMRLYVCHQMRLPSPQRSSVRSLTFARFARTFFTRLN